ncbi:2'-5' RNA ligase, partial [bacterium F16]
GILHRVVFAIDQQAGQGDELSIVSIFKKLTIHFFHKSFKVLFIALALPDPLKKDLKHMTDHGIRGVRWSKLNQLHITLHFLGDTKASLIPKLMEELSQIKVECFQLTLNDCGFFPGYEVPKVFWLGLEDSTPLKQLHEQVQESLISLNLTPERRPFNPHLTMARMNEDYHSRRSNAHIFELAESFMDRSFEIDAFHLYSSDLQQGGSCHTCIHTVPCFNA